ncbi:MAG TPA: hypothetical protein VNT04_09510 [Gaiellaceae bacterium]|jgi:hypothetical protein|nr:hypothetical protein [Gaiellaceae bacterium]
MGEEREIQHDPQVLEGDDDLPRQPSPPLDPFTPEPGPRPGEARAFQLLWLVIAVLAALGVAIAVWSMYS